MGGQSLWRVHTLRRPRGGARVQAFEDRELLPEGWRDTSAKHDKFLDAGRILNPGPLRTDYPHAGILNTNAFLKRYPSTATNRNRARSRWTYYHFLGLDIEKSASRTTDPVALADTNNPTMNNPACTVCHSVLDPVAGAFQNYGDEGYYKDKWGGLDSLDDLYKEGSVEAVAVRAESSQDRQTLVWPVTLSAGSETLRVMFIESLVRRRHERRADASFWIG